MMKYYLYKLWFSTPVHFGGAAEGGKLEEAEMTLAADSLFSALCCELAEQGEEERLSRFIVLTREGKVRFSDLYPFQREERGEEWYYLPRPVLPPAPAKEKEELRDLATERKEARARKNLKKLSHLRASELEPFLAAWREGRPYHTREIFSFGTSSLVERVNCSREGETLPYFVRTFNFSQKAGLYGVLAVEEEAVGTEIIFALESLGLTGIGGKRSSGYGKFCLENGGGLSKEHAAGDVTAKKNTVSLAVDLAKATSVDGKALYSLLQAESAPCQMCLSVLLPAERDEEVLTDAWYQLVRRSGFITGAANQQQKKDSVYMLSAGSCLPRRLTGKMAVLGRVGGHEVLRYGYGMYAGLSL